MVTNIDIIATETGNVVVLTPETMQNSRSDMQRSLLAFYKLSGGIKDRLFFKYCPD